MNKMLPFRFIAFLLFIVSTMGRPNWALAQLPTNESPQQFSEETLRLLTPIVESKAGILIEGTSYKMMEAFVHALLKSESQERILLLTQEFKPFYGTYINFLTAVLDEVSKDPALLERMESELKKIQAANTKKNLPSIHLGQRLLPAFTILTGFLGITYGMWSGYLDPYQLSIIKNNTSTLTFALTGFIISSTLGEILVIKRSLKNLKPRIQEYLNSRESIKVMQDLLATLKNSESFDQIKKDLNKIRKEQQKTPLNDRVIQMQNRQLESFYQNQILGQDTGLNLFLSDSTLKDEYKKFAAAIGKNEQAVLFNKENSSRVSEEVQIKTLMKTRLLEAKVGNIFDRWASSGGSHQELLMNILEKKKAVLQETLDGNKPRLSARIMTKSLIVAATTLGIVVGVGTKSLPIDHIFSENIIDFIRSNSTNAFHAAKYLILTSLGFQIVDSFYITLKRSLTKTPPYHSPKHYNLALKMWEQSASRHSTSPKKSYNYSAISGQAVLTDFIDVATGFRPLCSSIF